MTITLKLPPETEARLNATAAAQGVSVEELLKSAIELLLTASEPVSPSVISPSERAAKFVAWTRNHAVLAPPLSDAAISRDSIYREREDQQR